MENKQIYIAYIEEIEPYFRESSFYGIDFKVKPKTLGIYSEPKKAYERAGKYENGRVCRIEVGEDFEIDVEQEEKCQT